MMKRFHQKIDLKIILNVQKCTQGSLVCTHVEEIKIMFFKNSVGRFMPTYWKNRLQKFQLISLTLGTP